MCIRDRPNADMGGMIESKNKKFKWYGGHPMLHRDIYYLVAGLAKRMTKGTILEIGTYSGGGTVMVASALHKNPNNPNIDFIAVEKGDITQVAAGKDQYYYCTKNLTSAIGTDLRNYVDYKRCEASDIKIESRLQSLNPIELLIIDADGNLADQLEQYLPYCADGCILVIDDYWMCTQYDGLKGPTVRACINELVAEGILKVVSLLHFSTIILQYGNKNSLGKLEYMPEYGTTK